MPAASPRLLWRGAKGGSATLLVGSAGPDMLELWAWGLRPGERYDAPAHPEGAQGLLHGTRRPLALAVCDVSYVLNSRGAPLAHTERPHAYACAGQTTAPVPIGR